MKLPNRKKAKIVNEKLTGYLLSEIHPIGKSKAKFFKKYGFDSSNSKELEQELLIIALNNEVTGTKETIYGVNYVIEGVIISPKRKPFKIKTVWFVEAEEKIPRLVTVIPDIIRKRK